MASSFFEKAYLMLSLDEGIRDQPYDDATGVPLIAPFGLITIGIGRNLDANPLEQRVIRLIFRIDLRVARKDAVAVVGLETWNRLSENRKLGLVNLAFNMGRTRLSGFKKMIAAIKAQDFVEAGKELRDSLWASQVDRNGRAGEGRDDRVISLIEKDRYDY